MATFIINITPTEVLNWSTPYERMFNESPDYKRLKVFGCLCFATNILPSRDKLDSRVVKCIFIGYNPGQKAFKLYDIEKHKVFVSRDVVFHEKIFPYKENNEQNHQNPIPITDEHVEIERNCEEESDLSQESMSTNTEEQNEIPLTRSQRETKRPRWQDEYVTYSTVENIKENKQGSTPYPLPTLTYTNVESFGQNHIEFMGNVFHVTEPTIYTQACSKPE